MGVFNVCVLIAEVTAPKMVSSANFDIYPSKLTQLVLPGRLFEGSR